MQPRRRKNKPVEFYLNFYIWHRPSCIFFKFENVNVSVNICVFLTKMMVLVEEERFIQFIVPDCPRALKVTMDTL